MILIDSSARMLKGNLHLHTTLSDGRKTPSEAARFYREAGYDFTAITDHNRLFEGPSELEGVTVLAGAEYDFSLPREVIHIVALGIDKAADEAQSRAEGPQKTLDRVAACGGFSILAHPVWSLNTPETMLSLKNVDTSEVYNSASASPWNADRADSSCVLDLCAAAGRLFRFVASDDSHWYNGEQCSSYTMLQCDQNDPEHIIAALKSGRFYASRGPEIRSCSIEDGVIRLDCSPAARVWFSSNVPWSAKRVTCGPDVTHAEYHLLPGETFVRATVEDASGRRAWTSPVAVG